MDVSRNACLECGRETGEPARTGRPRRYCSRSCQSRAYRRRRDHGRQANPRRTTSKTGELVDKAIALADAEGIGAVTLRAIAGTSLVEAQRAFGSRDKLVATMVQRLLTPPPRGTLTELAEAEWAAYRAHPWLVSVLASTRPPLVPAVLDTAGAMIDAFLALGFDPPTALSRYLALSAYVQGMALLLLSEHQEARTGQTYRTWWAAEARRLPRWTTELGGPPETADPGSWFRDGLDRVLDGLTRPPATPTPG
ncbi:TetR/AcrR family transcriptional regulator C-terminal domain-containing protein [Amycolatopsis sp. 195334CR]|uniref:TetR/AcrR family transcriptional regulator C-terminal domain-containing protein n=1 Tax=Amycolatopsis sp. 195334CR TaxID=2814588 RepID=UPI001A8FA472|nr:TetR/AcrR family transcriptional regulator C-terminal domain-containing protein [Amycolatopsis sp. 195334CR]MBN6041870.1 TetR/AcrR family transcriptional regulator C-terminal domain-containing protein [Amycolatopsis sp. 195334CR]